MSKYKEIETQITKIDHITRALDEMGVPYEWDASGLPLVNWQGVPTNQKALVVVRRKHLGNVSNDLGWALDPGAGAYTEIISEFDEEHEIARGVRQRCAFYQVEALAAANGYAVERVEDHGVQRVFVGR
jgi:hypothetical protein